MHTSMQHPSMQHQHRQELADVWRPLKPELERLGYVELVFSEGEIIRRMLTKTLKSDTSN